MLRRRALGLLAGSAVATRQAQAQSWQPDRPMRWVVGYPPGGASDIPVNADGTTELVLELVPIADDFQDGLDLMLTPAKAADGRGMRVPRRPPL